MILRPHHFLCFLAFNGIGYNKRFAVNLSFLVNFFKYKANYILFKPFDVVCTFCPYFSTFEPFCKNKGFKTFILDTLFMSYFDLNYNTFYKKKLIALKIYKNFDSIVKICCNCSFYMLLNKQCFKLIKLNIQKLIS